MAIDIEIKVQVEIGIYIEVGVKVEKGVKIRIERKRDCVHAYMCLMVLYCNLGKEQGVSGDSHKMEVQSQCSPF